MDDDVDFDTTIHEPSMTAGEVEMLTFALERARAQFAWKCGGLDTAGLDHRLPPSTMTLGGLVTHVAGCEERMTARWWTGTPLPDPWGGADHETDREWEWRTAAGDSPAQLYRLWYDAVERSRAAVTARLADGGLDQPARFTTPDGESPNLRRALVDMIEHYIRHTGHADLLREAVDGLVGEDPPR